MTLREKFVVLFVVATLAVGALVRCTLRGGGQGSASSSVPDGSGDVQSKP